MTPLSEDLFERGRALYQRHRDKEWGLTDCNSFVVMTEPGLTDALTADVHFRQAGFRPLLPAAQRRGYALAKPSFPLLRPV